MYTHAEAYAHMKGVMLPPDFEDEATLFSLASEYFDAANTLVCNPVTRVKVDSVAYYLLGHAAELLLKCFLFKRGFEISVLKKQYSHNLTKLVDAARSEGLNRVSVEHVLQLSDAYGSKGLEYRRKERAVFPKIDELLEDVKSIQNRVFDHIAEFGDKE